MTDEQIIIDVQIDVEKAGRELAATIKSLDELKQAQKALTAEIKAGNDADGQKARQLIAVNKAVEEGKARQKDLTAAVRAQLATNEDYGDSLNEMRRKLNDMYKAYNAMTAAQRDSEGGKAFTRSLMEQYNAVKQLEEQTGRFQRNVGNYPRALEGAIPYFDQINGLLVKLGTSFSELANGGGVSLAKLGGSVKAFGKLFLTPPIAVIVGVLSAIMFAFEQVQKAIKRNDDASTALAVSMSKLEPIAKLIRNIFDALAAVVVRVVEGIASLISVIERLADRVGLLSDEYKIAGQQARDLVVATDQLEDAERTYTTNSARRSKEVAELRAKAAETDRYNAKQRIEFLTEAGRLEKQNLEDEKAIAAERLRLAKEQNELNNDTSDEAKNRVAELTAALENAEQSYYQGIRRINSQISAARKEQSAAAAAARKKREQEAAAAAEAARKAADEAAEAEAQAAARAVEAARKADDERKQILKEYQDFAVSQIKDENDRRAAEIELQTERELEALRARYDALTATDVAAREQLATMIAAAEQRGQEKIRAIYSEADKEQQAQLKQRAENNVAAVLESVEAVQGLLDAFGEKNKALAVAGKAVALGNVAVQTGLAISRGVAAASETPWPANLAAIASTIAQVMTYMTTAVSTINSAKFAQGGVVGGSAYSGDRVLVRANSGEMFLNRQQQATLFEMIRQGGTAATDVAAMEAAFGRALEAMPAPVMIYSEFSDFQRQTATITELSTL